jgi:nicotinate-nucleotide--dimethylbenzimidazole phosphoribosyltransferase
VEERVQKTLDRVEPLKTEFLTKAQERLDILTKPQGSLGTLEEFAKRYVAIKEDLHPKIEKKAIFTLAGDHGVTKDNVSLYAREVTPQMVYNFTRQGAAINVLARLIGARLFVVDMGVDHDFEPVEGLIVKKIAGSIFSGWETWASATRRRAVRLSPQCAACPQGS